MTRITVASIGGDDLNTIGSGFLHAGQAVANAIAARRAREQEVADRAEQRQNMLDDRAYQKQLIEDQRREEQSQFRRGYRVASGAGEPVDPNAPGVMSNELLPSPEMSVPPTRAMVSQRLREKAIGLADNVTPEVLQGFNMGAQAVTPPEYESDIAKQMAMHGFRPEDITAYNDMIRKRDKLGIRSDEADIAFREHQANEPYKQPAPPKPSRSPLTAIRYKDMLGKLNRLESPYRVAKIDENGKPVWENKDADQLAADADAAIPLRKQIADLERADASFGSDGGDAGFTADEEAAVQALMSDPNDPMTEEEARQAVMGVR